MKRNLPIIMSALLACGTYAQAQTYFSDFDKANGANTYFELADDNWANPSIFGVSANAGSEAFMSANGNLSGNFNGLGIEKTLGGTIEDKTYNVSFYIATYALGNGVAFEDFTTLYIGGATGTMVWNTTPTPTESAKWVQWSGTYTPNLSDIGMPFVFKAVFNLKALKAIALDGPIGIATSPITALTSNIKIEDALSVYPNPFNDKLTIDLGTSAAYKVEIFNTAGEMVQVIDQALNTVTWNGLSLNGTKAANGVYTLRIQSNNMTTVKRVVLNSNN